MMRRSISLGYVLALFTAFFFISPALLAQAPADSTFGPLPVFELHSGFWINLHHVLYEQARIRAATTAAARDKSASTQRPTLKTPRDSSATLSAAEQRAWDDAVSYYAANYAGTGLLFNTELVLLKNQLGDFEGCDELSGKKRSICDAGLNPKLTQILEAAAPVYRARFWPADDRANRRWIAFVAPLVREQGVGLSQRLADIYQTPWPKEKIRVDVTAYANEAGAYTTLDPLRVVISSTDVRNQGAEAFEVLFHEASHGIAEIVQNAIIRECRQREKPIPRDLWHALIFYTTGEIIRTVMDSEPATLGSPQPRSAYTYTPYAIREGLYIRGWDGYHDLLVRFWQPYLDGKTPFPDAIAHMISAL